MSDSIGGDPFGLHSKQPPPLAATSLPPTAGSAALSLPAGSAQTGSRSAPPPGYAASYRGSIGQEPDRELGPGSLLPGAAPPGTDFRAPPPTDPLGLPSRSGSRGELTPQGPSFGYPAKPGAGSVEYPTKPGAGSAQSVSSVSMPPRSHAGMGLGQLPTIASSGESALPPTSGSGAQGANTADRDFQPAGSQASTGHRAVSGAAMSRDGSRASIPRSPARSPGAGSAVSGRSQGAGSAVSRDGSQQGGSLAPRVVAGTGIASLSPSSRGDFTPSQRSFVPPPFVPAPSPVTVVTSSATLAPSNPAMQAAATDSVAPADSPPLVHTFAPASTVPPSAAPAVALGNTPHFAGRGPSTGQDPFNLPFDTAARGGGDDAFETHTHGGGRSDAFETHTHGGGRSDAFATHTPGHRSPRSAEWRNPDLPAEPGSDPNPSQETQIKSRKHNRPEQIIMMVGVLTFACVVILPMSGAFVLLGDRHFRFWMGWEHPVFVLVGSICAVALLIVTVNLLDRRASQRVLNEYTVIHVGSIFAVLIGLVAVLTALPISRDMYITSGLLRNGCTSSIPDSTILQAHSKVLYNIRATPECQEQESVEECDGWKENRYTDYIRFLEEDMECGPLCPEEVMFPDRAKPMNPEEAHAYAVSQSRGLHFASSPYGAKGVVSLLQVPDSTRLVSPMSPRWSVRGQRHGKGYIRKARASFIGADPGDEFFVGDAVVLTTNATALENSFDHIDYIWKDLMHGMLGKEYRVLEVPEPGVVGLPSPDGSQKGVWYFPAHLLHHVVNLIGHPLVTPEKLFSRGQTRMSCYPLVAAHLESLAWSFTDPMFWQGVALMAVSIAASSVAFLAICCCPGAAWKGSQL